jgi:hypothetical protein
MFFNYRRETSILVDIAIWTSLALAIASSVDYVVRIRRLVNEGA